MSMISPSNGGTPIQKSVFQAVKEENKKLYQELIDPDAARRQAITKLSHAMLSLQMIKDLGGISDLHMEAFEDAYKDLTRSRFLLVEHADPDNVLDELSQL